MQVKLTAQELQVLQSSTRITGPERLIDMGAMHRHEVEHRNSREVKIDKAIRHVKAALQSDDTRTIMRELENAAVAVSDGFGNRVVPLLRQYPNFSKASIRSLLVELRELWRPHASNAATFMTYQVPGVGVANAKALVKTGRL